ncbi:MAG: response regulator [Magnetococcales bacterium]|nr:response regulator [Magnetococcales bacterium]
MKPKILLVDDMPENILATSNLLSDLDAEVVPAADGYEALAHMLDHDFAVVLLDAHMPVMDGFEVIRLMGQAERTRNLPIIMISAVLKDEDHMAEGYHLGAVDYLLKPFRPEILRTKIKVFLDLFRQGAIIRGQARELESQKQALQLFKDLVNDIDDEMLIFQAPECNLVEANMTALNRLSLDHETALKTLTLTDTGILPNGYDHHALLSDLARRSSILLENVQPGNGDQICHTEANIKLHEQDGVQYIVALIRDVTLRKQTEQFLKQTNEKMEQRITERTHRLSKLNTEMAQEVKKRRKAQAQAMRSSHLSTLGTLSASLAHEINNPNNSIHFNASFLTRAFKDAMPILKQYAKENGAYNLGGIPFDELEETIPQLLSGINDNSERIKQIVEDVKRLSRSNPDNTGFQKVDINDVINEVISLLGHQIRKHTDHFEITLPDRPILLRANPLRLEQVLINILMNGLQSLPNRNQGIHISMSPPESNEGMISFSIQDQGCGISDADLQRITDPFFSTRIDKGGTGLGLSISKRIIQEHGGTMSFFSEIDKGTIVTLTLPPWKDQGSSQ